MGPKKVKKNNKNSEDDQFPAEKQQKVLSKWQQALKQNEDQGDENQQQIKPKKAIFQFDFSRQKQLEKRLSQVKPQKDKYADLTPQQIQQLRKIQEKDKIIKQLKNQQKKQKRQERKKQIDALKVIEKIQKQKQQQQNMKVQKEIKKHKKKQSSPWFIPGLLFGFLIFMFFLQYKRQIHQRLSKFQNNQQEDYYQILEADQGNTDRDLKQKYKKLVLKYHPDRNQHCQNCKQKFDKIMKAWEILGDPQRRKQYDQNSGHISQLKSASTTLTPQNYHYMVQESKNIWMIQVYDSTNKYSSYFAQFWQQMVSNYNDIIKFGRVDVWTQSQMLGYLPYKFQVFPAVYVLNHDGYSDICSFDFQQPLEGLKKCLEDTYAKNEQKIVKQIPASVDYTPQTKNKLDIYLDGKLRANIRVKAYNKIYDKYFNYYYVQKQSSAPSTNPVRQATLFSPYRNQKFIFNFTQNNKKTFTNYGRFLQSFVIQQISTCSFISQCEQNKCVLVINQSKIENIKKQLPLQIDSNNGQGFGSLVDQNLRLKLPVYLLKDEKSKVETQIKRIQKQLQSNILQNFQIGLYQGGRIDLGYVDEISVLSVQQGERIELQCRVYTWKEKVYNFIQDIYVKFFGSTTSQQPKDIQDN